MMSLELAGWQSCAYPICVCVYGVCIIDGPYLVRLDSRRPPNYNNKCSGDE